MPTFKSLKSLKPSKVGEKLKATAKSFKSKSKTDAPAVDAVEPPPQPPPNWAATHPECVRHYVTQGAITLAHGPTMLS